MDRRYLISSYTRADAIADGDLIEIDRALLQEAGLSLPAVLSAPLFASLEPTPAEQKNGQSFSGRLWDLLMVFRALAKGSEENRMKFHIVIATEAGPVEQHVIARCHGDDDGNPCFTFMTPDCD
jgi:hypothetical protein